MTTSYMKLSFFKNLFLKSSFKKNINKSYTIKFMIDNITRLAVKIDQRNTCWGQQKSAIASSSFSIHVLVLNPRFHGTYRFILFFRNSSIATWSSRVARENGPERIYKHNRVISCWDVARRRRRCARWRKKRHTLWHFSTSTWSRASHVDVHREARQEYC